MEKTLTLDIIRVVEQAALACARDMGKGDPKHADELATEAMRETLNTMNFAGEIVIGEGERDEAPMLYIGEKVGAGHDDPRSLAVDIAVDPLEGTNLVATGSAGAITVMALSEKGGLIGGPDTYMEKLVVPEEAKDGLDITAPPAHNLKKIARALDRNTEDLVVVVLERDRHKQLIKDIRATGARIKLIGDGDVEAGISATLHGTDVHVLYGTGAAPEGIITAAAIKCMKGYMQGRFVVRDDADRERLAAKGVDPNRVYEGHELAPGKQILFAATGVTTGDLLDGVRYFGGGARTNTLITSYAMGTARFVDTIHVLDRNEVQFMLKQ